MDGDPFEDLFGLEDKYYDEGFKQGFSDGSRQSRIGARLFGIEKGYEKFILMGELQATAKLWATRLPSKGPTTNKDPSQPSSAELSLPSLVSHTRLEKHIETLLALVDSATLSMDNSDDAVAEFDDRLKRAQAKAKVIERIIGENSVQRQNTSTLDSAHLPKIRPGTNMEDFGLK